MSPIDDVYKMISSVTINLTGLQENIFESLKGILSQSSGRTPIYLNLHTPLKNKVQMLVGDNYFVTPSHQLIGDIEDLIGHERLVVAL